MKETKRGITLIALVITIIVMLILVAVTVTIAVNGGLFEYAGKAAKNTIDARDLEQEYASIPDGWTYENLIEKYSTSDAPSSTFTVSCTFTTGSARANFPETVNRGDNLIIEYYNESKQVGHIEIISISMGGIALTQGDDFTVSRY